MLSVCIQQNENNMKSKDQELQQLKDTVSNVQELDTEVPCFTSDDASKVS